MVANGYHWLKEVILKGKHRNKQLNVRIPDVLLKWATEQAAMKFQSRNMFVVALIQQAKMEQEKEGQ